MKLGSKSQKYLAILAMGFALAACGKDDDKKPGGSGGGGKEPDPTAPLAPFLSPSDFNGKYGGLEDINRGDLQQMINTSAIFMQAIPRNFSDSDSDPAEEKKSELCALITDSVEVLDSHTMVMRIETDSRQCNPQPNKDGITITLAQRGYSKVSCSEAMLDVYKDTKASARFAGRICPNDTHQEQIVHQQEVYTFSSSKGSAKVILNSAYMASDGTPCVTLDKPSGTTVNDCGTYQAEIHNAGRSSTTINLTKIEAHGLVGQPGHTYYSAGYFDVTLNHWNGRVSYGTLGVEGGDAAPKYEFKNPMRRESASGVYQYDNGSQTESGEEKEQEE